MKVKQLSIFLENRAGRLAEIARLLGDARINIRALSLADTSDFGILRLIVNDVNKALQVLRDAGHTVSLTDVVAVEVPDHPGGLAGVLEALRKANVNVEYMYAFVEKSREHAVMVFRIEDLERSIQLLLKRGLRLLSTDEVVSL
jgi:hypothetical protein